jgi:hypothetical protein
MESDEDGSSFSDSEDAFTGTLLYGGGAAAELEGAQRDNVSDVRKRTTRTDADEGENGVVYFSLCRFLALWCLLIAVMWVFGCIG